MNSEFQQEQKRVDRVIETITEQISKLEKDTSRHRNEVVQIRKHPLKKIRSCGTFI